MIPFQLSISFGVWPLIPQHAPQDSVLSTCMWSIFHAGPTRGKGLDAAAGSDTSGAHGGLESSKSSSRCAGLKAEAWGTS